MIETIDDFLEHLNVNLPDCDVSWGPERFKGCDVNGRDFKVTRLDRSFMARVKYNLSVFCVTQTNSLSDELTEICVRNDARFEEEFRGFMDLIQSALT